MCKGNKMDKSDFYNKIKRDNMWGSITWACITRLLIIILSLSNDHLWYDYIISLRVEVWAHKTILTQHKPGKWEIMYMIVY
jgi:hypothetical protein